jgi:hypothetical protein
VSYELHEPEASAAFSLTGGGLFPKPGASSFPSKSSLWRSPRAETRGLTVPSADSYPPLLNAGREFWSYNAITASTSFASTMKCHAAQLGSLANRSCEGELGDRALGCAPFIKTRGQISVLNAGCSLNRSLQSPTRVSRRLPFLYELHPRMTSARTSMPVRIGSLRRFQYTLDKRLQALT